MISLMFVVAPNGITMDDRDCFKAPSTRRNPSEEGSAYINIPDRPREDGSNVDKASKQSHHEVAIAGAGTGKTYSLVENYLCALFGLNQSQTKIRPQEILALTFTDKAASEMRLRITRRLTGLLSSRDQDDALMKLANSFGMALPDQDEIRRIVRALPNAHIATFHSFCSQLLRQVAQAIQIDDRFVILSPKDELMVARNILRPLIINEIHNHNRHIKNLVVRLGLSQNLSTLGLLDSILDVYFRLFEKNIGQEQLADLTMAQPVTKEELSSCLHEIEQALMRFRLTKPTDKTTARLDHVASIMPDLERLINSDNEALIARTFKQLRSAIGGNFGEVKARSALVMAVSKLGGRLVDYFVHPDEVALARLVARFHDSFMEHKRRAFLMSYSDLLLMTKVALSDNRALRKRVKSRIQHILIDEYQDTSPIQQDIVALLCEDRSQDMIIHENIPAMEQISFVNGASLFVVGDKKQSIYGFRGASIGLFDRMINKMQETHGALPSFTKRFLTTNRRSEKRIIELVNLVAHHTLTSQGYDQAQALQVLPDAKEGHCGLWVKQHDQNLDRTTANLFAAAFGIADLLSKRTDLTPQDVVVLVRRIKSASVIKQKLSLCGISSRIVGGDGFFQQQEVVDLLSALKLINDPGHNLASGVVLRSPLVLLSDQEIMRVAMKDFGLSLIAAIELAEQGDLAADSMIRLNNFIAALKEASSIAVQNGLAQALDVLIEACDLSYLYAFHDTADQKWANIEKLRTMLTKVKGNPFSAIEDLYEEIVEPSKEPQAEGPVDNDAVTIMTIHQSKGLEFKVVVIADGESTLRSNFQDLLVSEDVGIAVRPLRRAISSCLPQATDLGLTRYDRIKGNIRKKEQDELARLLYVALTRAQEEVYVSCSNTGYSTTTEQMSLVGLFLRAYHKAPDDFQNICEVSMIDEHIPEHAATTIKLITPQISTFHMPTKVTRFFASAFNVKESSEISGLVITNVSAEFRDIDGNLAHQLLASCGNAIWKLIKDDYHSIDGLLDAAVRAQGLPSHLNLVTTKAAVMNTIHVLRTRIPSVVRTIFEMPLSVMPVDGVMIEGYADLVVVCEDFVGVIEFKSSIKRVLDVNTYLQVLAYAHALSLQFVKPIKFSVVLVGANNFSWQSYDQRAREIFQNAVRSAAH